MNEVKCPNCGKAFTIDEASYNSIAEQVRDKEFAAELDVQMKAAVALAEAKKDQQIAALEQQVKNSEEDKELALLLVENSMQQTISEKDNEIINLRARLEGVEEVAAADKEAAVKDITARATQKISELQEQLGRVETERALAAKDVAAARELAQYQHEAEIQTLKDQHALIIRQKDEEIAFYKDFKARMSTKMIGETLEQHCEAEFSRIRPSAFPGAYFEKDTDISMGSKGDYILRDYDENGKEIVSAMIEMKNEEDGTTGKHKNEDYLKKLDKDRRDKHCEYAVLVSMLEPDSEIYNASIVDMSHRFEKMYVVRPQFFIPLLCLLRDMARSRLEDRRALNELKKQDLDIERFTGNLLDFKTQFSKNYQ